MDKFFFNEQNKDDELVKLSQLKLGDRGYIIGFENTIDIKTKRRFLELGFIKNTIISLNNISFLQDVFLIEINGFMLAIRKEQASNIFCRRILC